MITKLIFPSDLIILKQRRRELNIKQKTIAHSINRTNSWYSKFEKNVIKKVDIWVYSQICTQLKLTENLEKIE